MTPGERGFLLLCSRLGDPERKPLTPAQIRTLGERIRNADFPANGERELELQDLKALGYGEPMARRILTLLRQEDLLESYLRRGTRSGCLPVSRVSSAYPQALRQRLGGNSPGSLWLKGDVSLLEAPKVALVGSRDLLPSNRDFAREVGYQAARQGFVLVSGNARGADREAQQACLREGGWVISVVADELERQNPGPKELYLAEDAFEEAFTPQRALSRNRVIHCLASVTLVAQCTRGAGGTWDGTTRNLQARWSRVCCFADGSGGAEALEARGARLISREELTDLSELALGDPSLFDGI